MKATILAAALAAAAFAFPASAILTRADRDDEEYRELATRYPAAVSLGTPAGTGALIAPRWILTTAGAARALRSLNGAVVIEGQPNQIRDTFVHPEWGPGGEADIALVFLRAPVTGVEPVPIYRQSDEAGQAARIVGRGASGRIGGPSPEPAGVKRAAINTVDRVARRTLGMRVKGPEDASDLQGALAADDLGAPAFFEAGGRILLGGIASRTEAAHRDASIARMGDWETYTRVSAFADWIDEAMAKAAVAEAAREVVKPAAGAGARR